MRFRINFAVVAIARLALVALLVSGCASVTPQADQTLAQQQSGGEPVLTLANSLQRPTRPVPVPGNADLRLPVVYIPADAPVAPAIDLTSDSEDIVQRMRNGFSMPDINNDLVLYQQQWYMNRPDYLHFDLDPVNSTTSSASWRIVNSCGLPMLIGPVTASQVAIRRIKPSIRSST